MAKKRSRGEILDAKERTLTRYCNAAGLKFTVLFGADGKTRYRFYPANETSTFYTLHLGPEQGNYVAVGITNALAFAKRVSEKKRRRTS